MDLNQYIRLRSVKVLGGGRKKKNLSLYYYKRVKLETRPLGFARNGDPDSQQQIIQKTREKSQASA